MVKLVPLVSLLAVLPSVLLARYIDLPRVAIVSIEQEVHSVSSGLQELRLIQTSEAEPAVWMTEVQIMDLLKERVNFMDITDYQDLGTTVKTANARQYPIQPAHQDEVHPFLAKLTTDHMKGNLEKLTSFRNRYYRSKYGEASSKWLFKHIKNIAKNAPDGVNVSVRKFKHNWPQSSIIARFEGSDPTKDNELVIVGAHQDSVNAWFPSFGTAPGADDDGSGTVTILEAYRVLVEGGFQPIRPVEFHWYSAEEAGLLGSQAVATQYEKEGRDVVAMLQNDMTGYVGKNPESFGIVTDYVDEKLTNFIKVCIETYAAIPIRDTKCGYACSDHASWAKAGYPSAFAIESEFHDSNPYIHSSNDVIKNLSFDHMLEFSKLSVSFVVELSHI